MDIRKWLQETSTPVQPPSPLLQCHEPRSISPGRHRPGMERASDRDRSTSDSSLLQFPPRLARAISLHQESDIEEDEAKREEGARGDASHPASCSQSSHPYRRTARHKTRPERYEPDTAPAKKRGSRTLRERKDKSNKQMRKARRTESNGPSKPDIAVVRNFYANNVPRDRLTLKPREKLGLFSKGRVSSPVKGRGLPDLVFSEMKFLQRDKDQPEAGSQLEPLSRKRKKTQAHAKEEEISTYFTSVRPTLTERNSNLQGKEKSRREEHERTNDTVRDWTSEIGNIANPTEATEKMSYLGYGGRGASHESAGYVSWSESIRAPSASCATTAHSPSRTCLSHDQHHAGCEDQKAKRVDIVGEFQSKSTRPRVIRDSMSSNAERLECSSPRSTNVYLPRSSLNLPHSKSSLRHITVLDPDPSTSHQIQATYNAASPLPKAPSVSQRDDQPSTRQNRRVPSFDERNVETPSVQHVGPAETRDSAFHHRTERTEVDDVDAQSCSSIGHLLQQCNTTFNNRHILNDPSPYQTQEPYELPLHGGSRFKVHRGQQTSTVRFMDIETPCHPRPPILSRPSIYKQQQRREEALLYDDCKQPLVADYEDIQEGIDAVEEGWGADVGDLYDQESDAALVTFEEGSCARVSLDVGEDRAHYQRETVAKPGFWRPNKLY